MPEGDTIHTLAKRLAPILIEKEILSFSTRLSGSVKKMLEARVTRIDAVGKQLLIRFSNSLTLRVHLGLTGLWRRYPTDKRLPTHLEFAPVKIKTENDWIICVKAQQVDLSQTGNHRERRILRALGPDLCAEEFEPSLIWRNVEKYGRLHSEIGCVLLDQRIAAGIGNVFKSEVLFIEGVNPWETPAELGEEQVTVLYTLSSELLKQNVGPGSRRTVSMPEHRFATRKLVPKLWVYNRHNKPCMKCNALIQFSRQGDAARNTYFCPRCQPKATVGQKARTQLSTPMDRSPTRTR